MPAPRCATPPQIVRARQHDLQMVGPQHRETAAASAGLRSSQPSPISVARNASSTARLPALRRDRQSEMLDPDAAAEATSAQTCRDRIARCQHWPCCCPVTVIKPKLRIEAPFALASRSMTTTRSPGACRKRVGETADAAPDNGQIEFVSRHAHRFLHICARASCPCE